MASKSNIESLISGLPSAMVSKVQPGFYKITNAYKGGEPEKVALVHQLFERFPVRLIWLKDLNEETRNDLGAALNISGRAGIWTLTDTVSLERILDGLSEGGWAMFFLTDSLEELPTVPEFLPTQPEQAISLLQALRAKVAIISWYDDSEWLIVSSPHFG